MTASSVDRLARNRDVWTLVNAQHTDGDARSKWASDRVVWGLFGVPDDDLGVLGDVEGLDVVELGCGSAYFSAWLMRAGARPVAVDLTPAQLETARDCQLEYGLEFPLVEANAEDVPLPDGAFDLVVSEHGAGVWCEPDRWVKEAARLLRPGGRLVFLVNSLLSTLCVPAEGGVAGERLLRGQRGLSPVAWPGGGVEHHLSHGEWIAVLRRHGFTVEALHELYPPAGASAPDYYEIVSAEWAGKWPAEELWVAHQPLTT
ncbi:MAG: class I SAM-dependent methyltransferase [Actinomycetes bacterium]